MESDPEIWVEFEKISDVLAPVPLNQSTTNLRKSVFHLLGALLFGVFCSGVCGAPSNSSPDFGRGYGEFDDLRDPISSHQNEFTACEEEENEDLDDTPLERSNRQIFAFRRQVVSGRGLSCELVQSAKRYLLFCCLKVDC